jgi:hypothetical protein
MAAKPAKSRNLVLGEGRDIRSRPIPQAGLRSRAEIKTSRHGGPGTNGDTSDEMASASHPAEMMTVELRDRRFEDRPLEKRHSEQDAEAIEPFVDADTAAAFLCVTRRTLLQKVRCGKIPGHPLDSDAKKKDWRFKLSELDHNLSSRVNFSGQRPEPSNRRI